MLFRDFSPPFNKVFASLTALSLLRKFSFLRTCKKIVVAGGGEDASRAQRHKQRSPETNLEASESGGYSCSMCRTDPPNGNSSGTTLGVPFKALLHRHNAAVLIGTLGTALQRGESSVADIKTREPGDFSSSSQKTAATYSPTCAVPSALLSLTTLFGMGRGGTSAL